MSKNYYRLYMESVIKLASTLSIKSEQSATAINQVITAKYGADGVDLSDPTTWKYYLNICGEYHFDDEKIYVTSLDTLESIEFNKSNLLIHKATAAAYAYGSTYYQELVQQYPLFEQLILGVLYPANMAEAVAAKDGTILSYPTELIESNEASLIDKLQTWIYNFKHRYDNTQYNNTDSLYGASILGIMYMNLVPQILNIRTRACKTNEAHSFHVRQYLASHSGLDKYLDAMTLEQSLFLYRNIAYIERHSGTQKTLALLIENIMTKRDLPLAKFVMKHNVSGMPDSFYAEPSFIKSHLNLTDSVAYDETISLTQLLEKERDLNLGNSDYIEFEAENINKKFKNSLSSVVITKALESSVISYEDMIGETLSNVLVNEWLDLSTSGLYNVYVRTPNPVSGDDMVLSVKDAFMYAIYCFVKAQGLDLEKVPKLVAKRVQRIPTPTATDLMSVVMSSRIALSQAQDIIGFQPTIGQQTSTENFYNTCVAIRNATRYQAGLVSIEQDMFNRGMVFAMVERMYSDKVCSFAPDNTLMSDWLASKVLPAPDSFTSAEYLAIYNDLMAKGTGLNLVTTQSVAELQAAMVGIMQQLSSYSVQYITNVTGTNVTTVKWASIRTGDIKMQEGNVFNTDISGTEVVSTTQIEGGVLKFMDAFSHITEKTEFSESAGYSFPVDADFGMAIINEKPIQINMGRFFVTNALDTVPGQSAHKTFGDYESFYSLTPEQQATIADIYTTR